MKNTGKGFAYGLCALLPILTGACSIGPRMMMESRPAYNIAIHRTEAEELLLNLVRLRYSEPVSFLTLSSISSQYTLGANASIVAATQKINPYLLGLGSDYPLLSYSEQPTITYTPLQGADFANRLMRETEFDTFAQLVIGDWSISRLMQLLVERVGRLRNSPECVPKPTEPESEFDRFMTVTKLWKKMQDEQNLIFYAVSNEKVVATDIPASQANAEMLMNADKSGYKFIRRPNNTFDLTKPGGRTIILQATYPDERTANEVDAALGIKAERRRLKHGRIVETIPVVAFTEVRKLKEDGEVWTVLPIQLRSFLDMMYYVAAGIEAPESHVNARVVRTFINTRGEYFDRRNMTKDLLNVRSARLSPASAYVFVHYRGYSFFIDDSEENSKETFALIKFLFSLNAGSTPSTAPILTLPIGK